MTVVSYTFNNAPLFPAASIFTTPPSSGTPGGYFFGSFTVDFSTDSIISSNFGFTPVGGPSVTFMNPNFLAGTPPGGFPVYTGLWFGSGISGGPDFISTDATGYEANLGWLQSSGITPSTISVNYLGPNSTIDTTSGDVTGTFLENGAAQVSAQALGAAPGPLPGAGLPALEILVLVFVASRAPKLAGWGRFLRRHS